MGRLPVAAALDALAKEDLVRILTEPKTSLVRQYQKLFAMDKVELQFTDPALEAIAERALESKTGARGLRTTLEELLLDTMFSLPSERNVRTVVVTPEAVNDDAELIRVTQAPEPARAAEESA